MPVRKTPHWRLVLGTSAWAMITLLLALVVMAGCRARIGEAGRDGQTLAAYRFRSLGAELPDGVGVRAAAAAAEGALRARGLVITRSDISGDRARIEARAHADGALDKTVVEAWTGSPTRVRVTAEPFGNEAASRAIFNDMLARLGR